MRPHGSGGRTRSPAAADRWAATAGRAAECHLFFDFDGTLAPIADDPSKVWPAPGVVSAMVDLSQLVAHVAIVSARPVDFLRTRFAELPREIDLYGLYGLEVHRGGQTFTDAGALDWAPTMERLAERARAELPGEDTVEFKRLSVALHYRTAPQLGNQVEEWAQAQARRFGLRTQSGRMVVELKPPGQRDKGTVIAEAIGSAGCAWYFGDDLSDIRAFQALRARAAQDPSFFGVCVAVANPETGQELSAAADLTLDSPAALADFLHTGVETLRR
jgi:trehalose 6-phosphate phosphatase